MRVTGGGFAWTATLAGVRRFGDRYYSGSEHLLMPAVEASYGILGLLYPRVAAGAFIREKYIGSRYTHARLFVSLGVSVMHGGWTSDVLARMTSPKHVIHIR